jgi:hypothetical protein
MSLIKHANIVQVIRFQMRLEFANVPPIFSGQELTASNVIFLDTLILIRKDA